MNTKSRFLNVILLFLVALAITACTGGSNNFGTAETKQMSPGLFTQVASTKAKPLPASAAARVDQIFESGAAAPANSTDYRIAALDVLEISVLGVPELTRTAQVSGGGMISMPLIKQVRAGGRTTGELERDIATKLAATYLQSPQVSVFVKEYNSQKITVDGAVQKPGIFPKQGDMSLLQAIALAQGLTTVADPTGVLIFRNVNGKRLAARYDIRQVRSGKLQDPMLLAGDVVMVDESAARTTLRDITSAMPLTGIFSVIPFL